MKEIIVFQQMVLGQLDIYMPNKEVELLPHTIHKIKINSKWILSYKCKNYNCEFIRENIRVNLHNLGIGKDFSYMTPYHK